MCVLRAKNPTRESSNIAREHIEMDDPIASITREQVTTVILSKFGFYPKNEQVDAIMTLAQDQKDLIFIAKTGFGKSIIFQAMPLMFSCLKIALIIMPLKTLEAQQCKKLSVIEGCKPFVLDGDSNNSSNLKLIRENNYTHGVYSNYD